MVKLNNTKKLSSILHDALADYANHADSCTPSEWLQKYLGEQLSGQSIDIIHTVSSGIIDTIDLMEKKKAEMDTAIDSGKSAENWFANDIKCETGNNGEKARMAAEFFNGIIKGEKSVNEAIDTDFIDVSENPAEWQDDNWNDYKLKDTVKGLALEAGRAGLTEIASDIMLKASEEGFGSALSDSSFIMHTLMSGANSGLKVAISAGLRIAEENGILPTTTIQAIAATAFKTVENMKVFAEVSKGKLTITEALISIKNTSIATLSGIWKQYKNGLIADAVDIAGTVFGAPGAIIAGAASGLIVESNGESRLVTVLKEAGKAALRFLTKEIHVPFFSKNKALELNNNNN